MSHARNRRTRVLQVIETWGPGGAETIFVELSDELRRRGRYVATVVGNEGWLADTLRARSLATLVAQSGGSLDLSTIRRLVAQIREHRVDIVHAHLFDGALYAGLAARICNVPMVVTLHGQADIKATGVGMAIKRRMLRYLAKRIVYVSASLKRDLSNLLNVATDQDLVITNGVARGAVSETSRSVRPSAAPVLVAVGNIREPKGYPVLLSALSLLREKFPQVRLRIAGQSDGGPIMRGLETQVHELALESHVEFLGFVANPEHLLAEADCFVLSSYREGFSLATIEAMLAGVPVVATRSGGPEEILHDGDTGLLVPPGDHVALAEAIGRIIESPALSRRLSARAREVASTNYSFAAMVDSYEALYDSV